MNNLTKAIVKGNLEELRKEISKGCDIDFIDKAGRSLLITAVIEKNMDIVQYLVDNGADINIRDFIGFTALHYAAQNYSVEMCRFLLENDAEVNIKDEHGNTPLFRAVFSSEGRGDVIKTLLLYGADKNLKNNYNVSAIDLANTIDNYDIKRFFE